MMQQISLSDYYELDRVQSRIEELENKCKFFENKEDLIAEIIEKEWESEYSDYQDRAYDEYRDERINDV
jgi:hypothetical protein